MDGPRPFHQSRGSPNARAEPFIPGADTFSAGDLRPAFVLSDVRGAESRNLKARLAPCVPTFVLKNAQGMKVFVFVGPTMSDAILRYNLYTGGGALLPKWGRASSRARRCAAAPSARSGSVFLSASRRCSIFGSRGGCEGGAAGRGDFGRSDVRHPSGF